ncbi:membrane protein of unknown function [Methylocella tundrae]|uniref:Uncharacterized protein n=1 Tax=Methylocella tundrae TaxID=227605 RepID=A0A4U8Z302_METTU|nr:hypothetical protein [Methylocella tundrae]VFU09743.1 membrane protein of unknown function [Methylocella tundrae]
MGAYTLFVGQIFNGFSVASLFVLAALGLALSFGLMRVINMAHGEMLMLGGYLAYLTLIAIPGPLGIIVAMPIAFLGAALVGAVIEMTVIHRLASRPLDTLLATWGVSLILQQAARNIFGAIGVGVTAPAWLDHSFRVESGLLAGLNLPATRIFILFVAIVVLAALSVLMARSRLGLLVRAVNQDRFMAGAAGINVRQGRFIGVLPRRRHRRPCRRGPRLAWPRHAKRWTKLHRAGLSRRDPRRPWQPCRNHHRLDHDRPVFGACSDLRRRQHVAGSRARFRHRIHSIPAARSHRRPVEGAGQLTPRNRGAE